MAGDLADRASIERALAGAYGCFGVTNFWEHFDKEAEHSRNLVDAGVSAVVPVDLHIRGCPPSPTRLLMGLLALLEPAANGEPGEQSAR